MKLLLALVALIAAVAATGYGVNTVAQDTNTGYQNNGRQGDPGYNHVFEDFEIPKRHHRRHHGRHHGRHHRDRSDSSDSDSRSWSRSNSRSDSRDYSSEYIYLRPRYGAQNPPSYGAASNDAPAQTVYGAPAQDSGNGY
ncbi:unnamed protein product [Caenorhabditis nigoni]